MSAKSLNNSWLIKEITNKFSYFIWYIKFKNVIFFTAYSVEAEHTGFRRIAGYGVTVSRGAASALMFAYATILLTMCRNTITFLRETFFHKFIPFDAAISFHKYIAIWALFFTCKFHSLLIKIIICNTFIHKHLKILLFVSLCIDNKFLITVKWYNIFKLFI